MLFRRFLTSRVSARKIPGNLPGIGRKRAENSVRKPLASKMLDENLRREKMGKAVFGPACGRGTMN